MSTQEQKIHGAADMRRVLLQNPDWDMHEAFQGLFGVPMTKLQASNVVHEKWGSLGDPMSIKTLPDQYQARLERLWERYPAISFSIADIAPSIVTKKYEPHYVDIPENVTSWITACFGSTEARDAAERITFAEVSPLTKLYREILRREPDPEGFAFWNEIYEREDWRFSEIAHALRNSEEAQQ
ncbi:MAG: hypothetical protein AAF943_15765 [Pseudomonadota bacterium]